MYVVSKTETKYFFNFTKPLLTWSSECDQQVWPLLFQRSHVSMQQEDVEQTPEETDQKWSFSP